MVVDFPTRERLISFQSRFEDISVVGNIGGNEIKIAIRDHELLPKPPINHAVRLFQRVRTAGGDQSLMKFKLGVEPNVNKRTGVVRCMNPLFYMTQLMVRSRQARFPRDTSVSDRQGRPFSLEQHPQVTKLGEQFC